MTSEKALKVLNKILTSGEAWWVEDSNVEHIEIRISPKAQGALVTLIKEVFKEQL